MMRARLLPPLLALTLLLPVWAWAQGTLLPVGTVTLHSADSQELVGEPGAAAHVLDGNPATIWFTQWFTKPVAPLPHWLILDLGRTHLVDGLRYLPRQDGNRYGRMGVYEIAVSDDPAQWPAPVASGTFPDTMAEQTVRFAATAGRYVRLVAHTTVVTGHFASSAAEVGVYATAPLTLAWDQAGTPDHFTLYRSLDGGDTYEPYATLPGDARTYDAWEVPADASVCYVLTNTSRGVESLPNRWPLCLDALPAPGCVVEVP